MIGKGFISNISFQVFMAVIDQTMVFFLLSALGSG
jgi:hypothetical protein